MIVTTTSNIEIEEGGDIYKVFSCKDASTGLPEDLTGHIVEMQIRFEYLPEPIIYRSDVSTNITLGGMLGTIKVFVPWLSTFNTDYGKGNYKLYVIKPSGVTTMHSKGFFTIIRGTTSVNNPGTAPVSETFPDIILNPKGPSTTETSTSVVLATNHPVINVSSTGGLGTMAPVTSFNSNGTPLGEMPSNAVGARFYLSGLDRVSFTIAGTQPNLPPPYTFTLTADTTGPNWDENLSSGQMIYVTAVSGSPLFRWI